MCILLNYCPRTSVLSGKNNVEKKTIRAAYHFFKGSAAIDELFAQVELQLRFAEEQEDTEDLLLRGIEHFETSIDFIVQSIQLANTVGMDDTTEKSARKILGNATKTIEKSRPFANVVELEPLVADQLKEAAAAQQSGGSQGVLHIALTKLGQLTDSLTMLRGNTRDIEAMTGAFASITKRIAEYKTFAFVVSQTYKAVDLSKA